MKNFDIQIQTDILSLNMLAIKYSKESEIASYVLGMTSKMKKDIREMENDNKKRQ